MKLTFNSLISGLSATVLLLAIGYGFYAVKNKAAVDLDLAQHEMPTITQIFEDLEAPEPPQTVFMRKLAPTQLEFTWSDAEDNLEVTGYDIFRNGTLIVENVPDTRYIATNLSPNTTYVFTVRARDAHGNVSGSSTITMRTLARNALPTTLAQPRIYRTPIPWPSSMPSVTPTPSPTPSILIGRPTISGLSASPSLTSAIVTWTTDRPVVSKIEFGRTSGYGLSTPVETSRLTSHSITIGSLLSSSRYYYRIVSYDAANTAYTGDQQTFWTTTAPDVTAPAISGVAISGITSNSAYIAWATNEASDSDVEYGLTTGYGSHASLASNVTSHSVNLTGLSGNTIYHFRVWSTDPAGNGATSQDYTLQTLPADTLAPVISNITISSITSTGATVNWTTNEPADSQVEYSLDTSYTLSSSLQSALVTSHTLNLTSLLPFTGYHARVKSRDAAGNTSILQSQDIFVTLSAPPLISDVSIVEGISFLDISWKTNTEANAYVKYRRDADEFWSEVSDVNYLLDHTLRILDFDPGSTVHLEIYSFDQYGVRSESVFRDVVIVGE